MADYVEKDGMLVFGDDQVRIEQGPALKNAIATPELLHNDQTASHYEAGAFDALGKRIELGQPMDYLDHGGAVNEGSKTYYVYQREEIDTEDEASGFYVDPALRDADTGNRNHYSYTFKEVGTRVGLDSAIELASKTLAKMK